MYSGKSRVGVELVLSSEGNVGDEFGYSVSVLEYFPYEVVDESNWGCDGEEVISPELVNSRSTWETGDVEAMFSN